MRKFLAFVTLISMLVLGTGVANAKTFSSYLDYLNTDAVGTHPGVFVELGLNKNIGVIGGLAANRTVEYEPHFGVKLYSNDLYGQLMLDTNWDPALRIGVDVDIAQSIFGSVGYEWLYTKADDEFKYSAFGDGKIILSLGLRWGSPTGE